MRCFACRKANVLIQMIFVYFTSVILLILFWEQKITPTFSVSVIAKILISDTKCGIERNDFFIVLKAEVLGRELDCISRLVGVHIDL